MSHQPQEEFLYRLENSFYLSSYQLPYLEIIKPLFYLNSGHALRMMGSRPVPNRSFSKIMDIL
jgi:hypothetical protein